MIKKTVQRKINSTSLEKIENSKLSIQFSLDGFSFCISNEGNNEIVHFSEINFSETLPTPEKLLLQIKDIFKKITYHITLLVSLPKGLSISINFGSKVNTEIIASNIAIPVNTPK